MSEFYNADCILAMQSMGEKSVDFLLTDIPYGAVNRQSNGMRDLDKAEADEVTFDTAQFLESAYKVTKNSLCIFCGKEQFSEIFSFFSQKKGTTRAVVWEKTNPSPMNGQYIYLSGVEMAVWYKRPGAKTFNAHCKNTVFRFPNGKRDFHPTQKNLELFKELILDNTNEGDLVFDPCAGGGTTAIACAQLNREYLCYELHTPFYEQALERIARELAS